MMVLSTRIYSTKDDIVATLNQFEQWSVAHPYEASRVMSNNLNYNDVHTLITGENNGKNEKTRVTYFQQEDGNYDFCITALSKSYDAYRYSSTTHQMVKDITCRV